MAIKFFAVFFPTISTFGCFWSQWPTSLAVTSGCPTMRCGRLPSRSDVNIFAYAYYRLNFEKSQKAVSFPSAKDWYGEAQYGFYDLTISKKEIFIESVNYDGISTWKKSSKSVEVLEFDFGAAKLRNHGISMFCYRWYTWFLTSRIGWIGCMFCVWKRATLEKEPFFPKQRVHTEEFLQ